MNRNWTRIAMLVVVLASLAVVPAYGQSPSSDIQLPFAQTYFPATGDTMSLGLPPLWRAEEDYAQGWRTFDNLPEISRVIYELVAVNGLVNGGQLNFIFRVNNERVGTFHVEEGEPATIVHADFEFEPMAGPEYKFFMELETGIDPIQGAITIPLDTSPLLIFGFSGCPAETALNRAGDAKALALLRRFRNEVLGTNQALLKYVDAYHNHSAEAVTILGEHPLLLARTARLLRPRPACRAGTTRWRGRRRRCADRGS